MTTSPASIRDPRAYDPAAGAKVGSAREDGSREPQSWVFLDRDGVINVDAGHVGTWARFAFMPGVAQAIRELNGAGYRVGVVTNQAGIARSLYSEIDYVETTWRMLSHLRDEGAFISTVSHCPHHPTTGHPRYRRLCGCRKPAPGLFTLVGEAHPVCFRRSFMVGDRDSDLEAGKAAGIPAANCLLCGEGRGLPWASDLILNGLDSEASAMLGKPLPSDSGKSTELMGDFMRKDKVEELIVSLNEIDIDAVGGGATLNRSTISARDWNARQLRGCCTQGCCGEHNAML